MLAHGTKLHKLTMDQVGPAEAAKRSISRPAAISQTLSSIRRQRLFFRKEDGFFFEMSKSRDHYERMLLHNQCQRRMLEPDASIAIAWVMTHLNSGTRSLKCNCTNVQASKQRSTQFKLPHIAEESPVEAIWTFILNICTCNSLSR